MSWGRAPRAVFGDTPHELRSLRPLGHALPSAPASRTHPSSNPATIWPCVPQHLPSRADSASAEGGPGRSRRRIPEGPRRAPGAVQVPPAQPAPQGTLPTSRASVPDPVAGPSRGLGLPQASRASSTLSLHNSGGGVFESSRDPTALTCMDALRDTCPPSVPRAGLPPPPPPPPRRHLLSLEAGSPRSRCLQGRFLLSLSLWLPDGHPLPGRVCVLNPFHKDISPIGLRPP